MRLRVSLSIIALLGWTTVGIATPAPHLPEPQRFSPPKTVFFVGTNFIPTKDENSTTVIGSNVETEFSRAALTQQANAAIRSNTSIIARLSTVGLKLSPAKLLFVHHSFLGPDKDMLSAWVEEHPELQKELEKSFLMGIALEWPLNAEKHSKQWKTNAQIYTTKVWIWQPGWPAVVMRVESCTHDPVQGRDATCNLLEGRLRPIPRLISEITGDLVAKEKEKINQQAAKAKHDAEAANHAQSSKSTVDSTPKKIPNLIPTLAPPPSQGLTTGPTISAHESYFDRLPKGAKKRFIVFSSATGVMLSGMTGFAIMYSQEGSTNNAWLGPMVSAAALSVALGVLAIRTLVEKPPKPVIVPYQGPAPINIVKEGPASVSNHGVDRPGPSKTVVPESTKGH